MKKVLVAGGGIMGLTAAWYLAEAGHEVTLIDKYDFLTNCSTGNAGMIVPSHFIPLASPGIILQGVKWIFNPFSPFSMNFKPNLDLLKWGMEFWSSSNEKHVAKSASVLLDFNLLSKELYQDLSHDIPGMQLKEKGLLMLCHSLEKLEEEFKIADQAIELGLDIEKVDKQALRRFQTETIIDGAGGVLYKSDAHLSPEKLTLGLIDLLSRCKNVSMVAYTELIDFIDSNGKISGIKTSKGEMKFDELVIATGAFSQRIFRKLNVRAKIQPGKGYSFQYYGPSLITTPAILVDGRVSVTPYEQFTRFAGTMEIGGVQRMIKQHKVEGIVNSVRRFFPEIDLKVPRLDKIWTGLRPCSSDGLPYIGRIGKYRNVVIATGHSMMGISLAPATAKLVEELISGKKLSFDIQAFDPNR
jgi:D-amino-acid dehydrogenase